MKLLLIQRGGIYIEELVKNIILSIVTGIISGVIVTVYYRKKDAKKEKLKYLYDLRDYMYKLIAETIPLGLVYPEQIEKAHDKLSKYWGMLSPEFMLKIENLIINYAKKK